MRATSRFAARAGSLLALASGVATGPALAVQRPLDTTSSANGLTDIISFTFDGSLQNPFCTGLSGLALRDCQFFIGVPGPTRNVVVAPNPTGLANVVPGGIAGAVSGSFLDLTLNSNQTQVTLAGGTIAFPSGLTLTIQGTTIVNPSGIAGFVIQPSPVVAPVDTNGVAEIRVDLEDDLVNGPIAADFSTFSDIVLTGTSDCIGPQCVLIPILTLDMLRYRLLIDFDPTFSTFTASFVGQAGNSSLVIATLNSGRPEITVTDSVAPGDNLLIPFGDVTELTNATQTITVTNSGNADLLLGAIGGTNPLEGAFSLVSDTCTGATVAPAGTCTVGVRFAPGSVGSFTDSLDIPSNDADEPSVTVSVTGNGVATPVPNISITDSIAPATDQALPFGNATIGATVNATVTVNNDGNADLLVGTIASVDAIIAPFSLFNDNCTGQTVAPAASCTLGVRFQPTTAGAFADSFDIPSNDSADPTVTVAVSGTGTLLATPEIQVEDNVLPADDRLIPFGNITEGSVRDRAITLTNVGGLDLTIGNIGNINPLAAPFSVVIDSDGCSAETLAPDESCTVVIRYAPPATGPASDSLNIPSNDPNEPSVTIDVTGTGITEGEGGVETPSPSGADGGFMAIDPATLLLLGGAGIWGWRRRLSR